MKRALKPGDAALFFALFLGFCCAGAWFWANSANGANSSANGLFVVTQTTDGLRRVDALDEALTFTVETPGTGSGDDAEGGINVVRIEGGAVQVESANCGNQVCVEHDAISCAGEQIVCLPHGMVVEVVVDASDATVLQQR